MIVIFLMPLSVFAWTSKDEKIWEKVYAKIQNDKYDHIDFLPLFKAAKKKEKYKKYVWVFDYLIFKLEEEQNLEFQKYKDSTKNELEVPHNYSCVKKYCSEMRSCEEAKYHAFTCWYSSLDRDNDWTPCENICK